MDSAAHEFQPASHRSADARSRLRLILSKKQWALKSAQSSAKKSGKLLSLPLGFPTAINLLLLGRSFLFGGWRTGLFGAGFGFRGAGSLRVDEVESILSVERILPG
jgi:hypothetical protein